jgi:hypothetical protein
MVSLYSSILWDKIGHDPNEFKIHDKEFPEILEEFKKYIENKGSEQFINDIRELDGIVGGITEFSYYDGPIYQHKTHTHESNIKDPEDWEEGKKNGYKEMKLVFHESEVLPSVLRMMMEFLGPDEVAFLADVHRVYYKNKKAIAVEDCQLKPSDDIGDE